MHTESTNMTTNTLSKNQIAQFVMRIDLNADELDAYSLICSDLASTFDRLEKREVSHMAVTFTDSGSSLNTKKSIDYVLVSEDKNITVTFSEAQNSIVLESAKYLNNSVYKSTLDSIIQATKARNPSTTAKRIGLRYVNFFSNSSKSKIGKIFSKGAASTISSMFLISDGLSRAIAVSEHNFDTHKARIQFGIPNKFYPAKMTNYDLLLDIDCYDEGEFQLIEWEGCIKNLNHAAYMLFKAHMNDIYIDQLK